MQPGGRVTPAGSYPAPHKNCEPRSADRTDQKIRCRKNKVSNGERAPKAEPVGRCTTENRKKPNHPAEQPGKGARLLCGKVQFFLQIKCKGRKRAVVGEALENLADIRDPKGPLEAGADLTQAIAEA